MARAERKRALVLALLALVIGLQRLHTYDEPLERDLTTYAVIGQGLLEGRPLYTDLWDHKPPAIYWTYAGSQAIAGSGALAIYLLGLITAWITLLGVYRAGSAGGWGAGSGLLAAAFWTVVASDLGVEANQPNTEVFMNACGIWLLASLLRSQRGLDVFTASLAGLLLGVAVLYKPVAAVWLGPVAVALLASVREGSLDQRQAVRAALACCAAAVAPVLITVAGFAATGGFAPFWDAVVGFNRSYAGDLALNVVRSVRPPALFNSALTGAAPLVAATALWFFAKCRWPASRVGLVLASYLLCSWVAMALPGRFFSHYYQLLIPPLAVGAAWGVAALGRSGDGAWAPRVRAAGVLVILLWVQLPSYSIGAEQWSRLKYGDVFVGTRAVGRWVDHVLRPDEQVYQWGTESGIYYYANRLPPSGVFFAEGSLLDGPLAASLGRRVLNDLRQSPPELFFVTGEFPPEHAVALWMRAHYSRLGAINLFRLGGIDLLRLGGVDLLRHFAVYYRKGGTLAERLDGPSPARIDASPNTSPR